MRSSFDRLGLPFMNFSMSASETWLRCSGFRHSQMKLWVWAGNSLHSFSALPLPCRRSQYFSLGRSESCIVCVASLLFVVSLLSSSQVILKASMQGCLQDWTKFIAVAI